MSTMVPMAAAESLDSKGTGEAKTAETKSADGSTASQPLDLDGRAFGRYDCLVVDGHILPENAQDRSRDGRIQSQVRGEEPLLHWRCECRKVIQPHANREDHQKPYVRSVGLKPRADGPVPRLAFSPKRTTPSFTGIRR